MTLQQIAYQKTVTVPTPLVELALRLMFACTIVVALFIQAC